nr:MAG TPA: hypothetical protein [Caudoviricetes sp.]
MSSWCVEALHLKMWICVDIDWRVCYTRACVRV